MVEQGRAKRNVKMAGLAAGVAGRTALGVGKRLTGKDKDEINAEIMSKTAEQVFAVLGELKGGAMKVGQALSVMEAAIPDEYGQHFREALTKLQSEAPPLPASKVHAVLDAQLGTKWRERFREFDDTPAAAASIGQVHKGIWQDGREVAVKIQYPGADHALRADLKTLSRMSGALQKLSPGTDVKQMMDELIARTEDELNYLGEADNQRAFYQAYENDPKFYIPKIIASSPKVIVSEWIYGRPLSKIISDGTQEERNQVGALLCEFELASPKRVGLLHGDPHPGNFWLGNDGRLIALDFGAVGHYPNGLPAATGEMLRLAKNKDYEPLRSLMVETNFIAPRARDLVGASEIESYLRPFVDPLYVDTFHFTRKWLQRTAGRATDIKGEVFQTSRNLNCPPQWVMVFRVLGGCVGIAAQLDCEFAFRPIAEKWIDGLAEPSTPQSSAASS